MPTLTPIVGQRRRWKFFSSDVKHPGCTVMVYGETPELAYTKLLMNCPYYKYDKVIPVVDVDIEYVGVIPYVEIIMPKAKSDLTPHWPNPWGDVVVYVPIEELASCHANLGKKCANMDGTVFVMTEETILKNWRGSDGTKLDAYILPQADGWHDMGIRYGSEGSQYLSPMGDRGKLTALLAKYAKH